MSAARHTPGPWTYPGGTGNFVGGPDRIRVADVGGMERSPEERQANARLIAAAPDLLAACKAAWPMLDRAADQLADDEACEESGRVADACATFAMDLRAAILKAEGGAS